MTGTYGLIFRSGNKTGTNGIISDRSLARAPDTGSIIIGAQGARGLRRSDDGSWTDRATVHARQSDRQLRNLGRGVGRAGGAGRGIGRAGGAGWGIGRVEGAGRGIGRAGGASRGVGRAGGACWGVCRAGTWSASSASHRSDLYRQAKHAMVARPRQQINLGRLQRMCFLCKPDLHTASLALPCIRLMHSGSKTYGPSKTQ